MKKVVIVPHLGKPEVANSTRELAKWLTERKMEVRIPRSDAVDLGEENVACADEELSQAELVVVLGGDGTILRAVGLLKGAPVPILGVNMGQLGFLSEVKVQDLYPALERVLKGNFELDQRMMIEGEIISQGKPIQKAIALNEIVIERGSLHRLLKLSVSLNGSLFKDYSVDGLIFATPTGSTAYSLSAGGPIVSPENCLILMTPVCPHGLFNRSLILSDKNEIEVSSPGEKEFQVTIVADGAVLFKNQPFDSLKAKSSKFTVKLVRITRQGFFDVLRQKLKP